jgi:hypothetical protein
LCIIGLIYIGRAGSRWVDSAASLWVLLIVGLRL